MDDVLFTTPIGTHVSVVVFQIRANRRSELTKLAMDTALKEFAEHRLIPGTKVAPLGAYVWFYTKFFDLVDKRKLTQQSLESLYREHDELLKMMPHPPLREK